MASSSYVSLPKNINNAPECSICLELVLDNAERSITKLHCGHLFHADCIGSEFNSKGIMKCPNCRRTEDGNWTLFVGSHEQSNNHDIEAISDIDEELEELLSPQEEFTYNAAASDMRQENFDPLETYFMASELLVMNPPPILPVYGFQIENDGCTRFPTNYVNAPGIMVMNNVTTGNPTLHGNEWIPYFQQQLPLHDSPPSTLTTMLVCQRQPATISSIPVELVPASYYEPTPPMYYEQARYELPSLELTLATGTSIAEVHQLPSSYYHHLYQSTSRRRY